MTKRHDIAIQHSSKRSDWRTPPELFGALDLEFSFVCDVAADATNHLTKDWMGLGAREGFEDALAIEGPKVGRDCRGFELPGPPAFFMNPPYSRGDKQKGIPAEPIEPWIQKAWEESQKGVTVVGVLPFSPQTSWYRGYVYGHLVGHVDEVVRWMGHAAMEVRQLPYRVTFIDPNTKEPAANAPGNTCVVIWRPNPGYVGPWQPTVRYWSYK